MKPKFRSLIAAFAPLSRSSLIVVASLCAVASANADQTWTGARTDAYWTTTDNWKRSRRPGFGELAIFDWNSTTLSADLGVYSPVGGLRVADPSGPVSVAGTNSYPVPSAAVNVDLDLALDSFTYSPLTPLVAGDRVTFTAATLPGGVTAAGIYYVVDATSTTFKISTTAGGAAVDITSVGDKVFVHGVITANNTSDVLTIASSFHSALDNGALVTFSAQTAPTGLTMGRFYHVVNASSTTFQVAASRGGAPVDFSTDGVNLRATVNNAAHLAIAALGVNMSAATQNLTIPSPIELTAVQTWSIATDRWFTVNGGIVGAGGITKTGDGIAYIFTANTYAGGTTIQSGELQLSALAKAGLGSITLDGGTLRMYGGNNDYNGLGNAVIVPAGKTGNLWLSPRVTVSSTVTGATDSTLNVGVQYTRDDITGNWSGFNGQINLSGSGEFRLYNGNGFANAKLNLGAGVLIQQLFNPPTGGETVQNIGELAGASGAKLGGQPVSGRYVNWTVGGLNTSSTFAGTILDEADPANGLGAARLTKVGTGMLTLSGTSTYTSSTTINNGTLNITGSKSGTGTTTVNSGTTTTGILSGTGSISGATTVASGGHLAPGDPATASGVGTLTTAATSGSLTFSTGSFLDVEFDPADPTTLHDRVTVGTAAILAFNSGIKLNLHDAGTTNVFSTNGTYTLFNVAGTTVTGFSPTNFVVQNPAPGKSYDFTIDSNAISLVIGDLAPANYWNKDEDLTWNSTANWSLGSIPNIAGAKANFGGGATFTGPRTVSLDGMRTVGEMTFNNSNPFTIAPGTTGSLVFNNNLLSGSLIVLAGEHEISAPVTLPSQDLVADVAASTSLTLSGVVSGAGASVTKANFGTLILTGDNTYDGGTFLNAGVVQIKSATSLGATTGAAVFGGGSLQLSDHIAADTRSYQVAGANNAVIDTNGFTYTFGGAISPAAAATGGLTKKGGGTLTLTGTNSYTGTTLVSAGELILRTGGVINGGALSFSATGGALFQVDGGSFTGTASTVAAGAAGLLVSSGSATFTGTLTAQSVDTGATARIKVEGGTLTATAINLGRSSTAVYTEPAAGATNSGLVVEGATAAVNISGNLAISGSNSTANARMDAGSLAVGGVVTIGLNSTARWSVLDVNGGTFNATDAATGVQLGNGNAGNAIFLVQDGGTATVEKLTFNAAGTLAYSGIVKLGAGTNGAGTLYVGSGGFVRTGTNALCNAALKLQGGTLGAKADWTSAIDAALTGTSEIKAADADNVPHNIELSGILSGTGGINKTGGGTLTLSGLNSYTGNTTVSAGTLAVTKNDVFGDASTVTIASGATLSLTHSGIDVVRSLVVNGDIKPDGVYSFGSGSIQVISSTQFEDWADSKGLNGTSGKEKGMNDDPDKDGKTNLSEFAFNGDPLSGSDNGQVYVLTADSSADGDSTKELILTLAVRKTTPAFSAGAPATAPLTDGIIYSILGSTDLATFGVMVTPVGFVDPGVALTDTTNYEYRSFSLSGSNGLPGKGFMRANVVAP